MAHEALYIPGNGVFPLLKPLIGFQREILSRLERYPYERNVFLMLRFRDSNAELSRAIVKTLAQQGLEGIRADEPEWNITNNVYNQIAVLYCCKYGIALFDEAETDQTFNPNVVYELGILQSQGKNCLILKHKTLPPLPFDLNKDLHHEYEQETQVRRAICRWAKEIPKTALHVLGGSSRIITVEEESLALGTSDLASLAARGLIDMAPQLGGTDLAALFAGAETSVDVGFPLFFSRLQLVKGELRDFVRHREGIANFIFIDPEAAFLKGKSRFSIRPPREPEPDYTAELNDIIQQIKSLVDQNSKATVRLYLSSCAPGYSFFRGDDRMIVAPWNSGLDPEEGPCLILEKRDDPRGIFSLYLDAFSKMIKQKFAHLIWTNRVF